MNINDMTLTHAKHITTQLNFSCLFWKLGIAGFLLAAFRSYTISYSCLFEMLEICKLHN